MTRDDVQYLLGVLIGGLAAKIPLEEVRSEVRKIAESDEVWEALALGVPTFKSSSERIVQHVRKTRQNQS